MKNPNIHLGVVLMNLNNSQLHLPKNFSSYSTAPNIGMQTTSTLIQKDLFELASKALLELEESKNSSSLIIEVNIYFPFYFTLVIYHFKYCLFVF